MLKRVLAMALIVGLPSAVRGEFVLDDFATSGNVGSGLTPLGNGFDRVLSRSFAGNLFEISGGFLQNFKVRSGTSVTADYTTASSLDIRGQQLLRFGMNLTQNIGIGDTFTISVSLTDSLANTETVARVLTTDSGTFGIDLSSISGSIRTDVRAISITWAFSSVLPGPPAIFGNGSGAGGFTFTPEPGSLALLSGASCLGLFFVRRRRGKSDEVVGKSDSVTV